MSEEALQKDYRNDSPIDPRKSARNGNEFESPEDQFETLRAGGTIRGGQGKYPGTEEGNRSLQNDNGWSII